MPTIEERVAALEVEVAALDERVTALEGGEPVEPPIVPPDEPLTLELLFADPAANRIFAERDAIDIGDYRGEYVTQRCLRAREGGWTIDFRPDLSGERKEIVVEYGVWPIPEGMTAGHILGEFTAVIRQGATILAEIVVPKQFWMTRWRWQSEPRPLVRDAEELADHRDFFPLSEEAIYGDLADFSLPSAVWSGPMDTAGIMTGMPTTGDRQEIGPITNLQASYLLRGNQAALDGLLAQAEAVGSFPWWCRDSRTGRMLDVFEHPYSALNNTCNANYPKIYPAVPRNEAGRPLSDFFQLNLAHLPNVTWIAWRLTDDPFFLEGSQAAANYAVIESNLYQFTYKLPGMAGPAATRAFAWALRDQAHMAFAAPELPPSWLHPRSYYVRMIADSLSYFGKHYTSSIISVREFHQTTSANGQLCPWMQGYLLTTLLWMKWTGYFPEWTAATEWTALMLYRFTDDPALGGWDRRWPAPYFIPLTNARQSAVVATATNPHQQITAVEKYTATTPIDWGEAWQLFIERQALIGKPINIGPDDVIYQTPEYNKNTCPSGPAYHEILYGMLGGLARCGSAEAREHWEWLNKTMPAVYESYGYGGVSRTFRWAYWPDS